MQESFACLRLRIRKCNGESLFRGKLMKNISYIDTRSRIRYNCTVSSPAARHRLFLGLFIGKHLLSLPSHTHTYKSWCLSLSRGFSGPADCGALSFWFSLDMCNEKAMLSSGCMYLTDASLCIYLCVSAAASVSVYTCNYNALLKATTIAQACKQADRQTDKNTVGQTDIQRKLTQHIHNLHVKLISFNLNAIWRRFTCCVPRVLRSKCTSISQILCGRYRYLHRDTTSRCCWRCSAAAHWFSANDAMRHVCASVNYAFIFMIYAFWLTALAVKVFLDFPIQSQIFSRGILVQ